MARLISVRLLLVASAIAAPAVHAAPPPAANPVRGGQYFLQCRACHTVGAGEAHRMGPNLAGVFGAKAASRPGYSYSPALTKAKLVWNPASLDTFLIRPSRAVPGTKMSFGGVANASARADLIAYLATLEGK